MSSATSATRGGATDVAKREPGSQLAQRVTFAIWWRHSLLRQHPRAPTPPTPRAPLPSRLQPQVFDPFADLGGLMLAPLGGDFFGLGSQLGLPSTQALMSKAAQNLPPLLKVDVIEDKDKYSVLADCPVSAGVASAAQWIARAAPRHHLVLSTRTRAGRHTGPSERGAGG